MHQQTSLNCPLLVQFHRQLFNFVHLRSLHKIFFNTHCKAQHAQHAQHVIIVVEKARLICKFDNFVPFLPQLFPWLEKLGLLYVSSVHLVQLPIVSICVDNASISNRWIYITHVLQTPQPSCHGLRKRKVFRSVRSADPFSLNGEKDRNKGKADTFLITLATFSQLFSQVINSNYVTSVALVHQTIYVAVKLTER